MKALFTHHPLLENAGILYDGASERRVNHTLEGGDVHFLRHDLVVLGLGGRSMLTTEHTSVAWKPPVGANFGKVSAICMQVSACAVEARPAKSAAVTVAPRATRRAVRLIMTVLLGENG